MNPFIERMVPKNKTNEGQNFKTQDGFELLKKFYFSNNKKKSAKLGQTQRKFLQKKKSDPVA